MLRVTGIKLTAEQGGDKKIERQCLKNKAAKLLRVSAEQIKLLEIAKKSIDARDKNNIFYVYSVDVRIVDKQGYIKNENAFKITPPDYITKKAKTVLGERIVVVGSGPAGLFAALILAESGLSPIVLERGQEVDKRKNDVEAFFKTGVLNTESNVLFGEGGAGTFSDGKLTASSKDLRIVKVFKTLIENGAPKEIGYQSKPHIGTDMLINVVKRIREKIKEMGGEFHFNNKVTGVQVEKGALRGLNVTDEHGAEYFLRTENAIFATGHSARDTYEMLLANGVDMKPKPFAVGVRIEHKQDVINEAQYGKFAKILPPADYKLTHKSSKGRGVYTFCMCPGGLVIPAATEAGMLSINGMSYFRRNSENANSALLVTVNPSDFPNSGVLGGVAFQRRLEAAAFKLGGGNYKAPVQLLGDFLNDCESKTIGNVLPSIATSYTLCDLRECLDGFIVDALKESVAAMDKKLKGFASYDSVLTGVESRSSSPVTIIRGEDLNSKVRGLIPCGEGAGHAGGIVSAAIDGIRCAESVLK